ncbi:hypothetical protein Bbelb_287970 [Branchiostoma belcheri]|nr:hypothetical protein Bbelb_287970 [Branchiostoma belcheri]
MDPNPMYTHNTTNAVSDVNPNPIYRQNNTEPNDPNKGADLTCTQTSTDTHQQEDNEDNPCSKPDAVTHGEEEGPSHGPVDCGDSQEDDDCGMKTELGMEKRNKERKMAEVGMEKRDECRDRCSRLPAIVRGGCFNSCRRGRRDQVEDLEAEEEVKTELGMEKRNKERKKLQGAQDQAAEAEDFQ